jgi:hypothetical protein
MRRIIVFFLILFFIQLAKAQSWSPIDSIKLSLKNKPNIILGMDKRNSYVVGMPVNIFGIRLGYDYGKLALLGAFYSASTTKEGTDNTYDYLILGAICEYHWYKNYRFRVYQTIQTGIGTVDIKERDVITKEIQYKSNMIIPIETGITGNIRFLKYFGLTAGIGVRTSFTPNTYYTAPYYSYGIMVFTKDLIKDIRNFNK